MDIYNYVQTMLTLQRCHLYGHMYHWHEIDFEVHEIKKFTELKYIEMVSNRLIA